MPMATPTDIVTMSLMKTCLFILQQESGDLTPLVLTTDKDLPKYVMRAGADSSCEVAYYYCFDLRKKKLDARSAMCMTSR